MTEYDPDRARMLDNIVATSALRERIDLWVQWPQALKPFVDTVDLQLVMAEPGDELVADDVVHQSKLLLRKPAQAPRAPRILEDRLHVVSCQKRPQ